MSCLLRCVESKKKKEKVLSSFTSTTTLHGGKSIFWERIPSLSFLKKEFQYRWGSLYRLKSRVLSFFLDCRNM
ncbi:unnamed protein product [Bathycoccus prasinos]